MKRWMRDQMGPRAMLDDLRETLPALRELLRELPGLLKQLAIVLARSARDGAGPPS